MADDAPGWDAITAVFDRLYPEQKPKHYGTVLPASLGGKDPLQGLSAYKAEHPRPHWHFVSYGLSELYAKERTDKELSGYGIELTFRLARGDEENPPTWALNFMQNLGRYVFDSGNVLEPRHHFDLKGPIMLGDPTAIRACLFAEDPQAGTIETPNGRVQFVQIVGITLDELHAAQTWDTGGFTRLLAGHDEMLVTDLRRTSLLDDPATSAAVQAGLEADGSSSGMLYVEMVEVETEGGGFLRGPRRTRLTLGANGVVPLMEILPYRLPFGRPIMLMGKTNAVILQPGKANEATLKDRALTITLTDDVTQALLATLKAKAGTYRLASHPDLVIEVQKSLIKDQQGKVTETIG